MSDNSDDQRLRVVVEHAMSDAATLATEIRGISHRVSVSDQGHIHHLRSIADRLDKLVEVLGLELQSPVDVDREGAKALASWGRRLSAAALVTIALVGHGGVTRGGEVAAEYLMRTLSEMIATADEPVSPAEKLGNRLSVHRQAQRLTAQELAARLEVTRQYVSALERGRSIPSDAKLRQLFEVLGLDPTEQAELSELRQEAREAPKG